MQEDLTNRSLGFRASGRTCTDVAQRNRGNTLGRTTQGVLRVFGTEVGETRQQNPEDSRQGLPFGYGPGKGQKPSARADPLLQVPLIRCQVPSVSPTNMIQTVLLCEFPLRLSPASLSSHPRPDGSSAGLLGQPPLDTRPLIPFQLR